MKHSLFIRNHRSGDLLETVLVSAITSLLGVRFLLYLSHYPQVGGQSLHIAHMLYGGALMLAAVVLMLGFLGSRLQRLAAVLGGLGFGVFIDELGKFITKDNNYFFQPAAVLIYVIFVALYFLFRWLSTQRRLTQTEYLMNALELMEEAVLGDLDQAEQQRIIAYLRRADRSNPLVAQLRTFVESTRLVAPPSGRLLRWRTRARVWYATVTDKPWFSRLLVGAFLLDATVSLVQVGLALVQLFIDNDFHASTGTTTSVGVLVASAVAAGCIIAGGATVRKSRIDAYEWFRWALRVNIFLKQPFLFYHEQFRAVFELAIYLVGLATLTFMISRERSQQKVT